MKQYGAVETNRNLAYYFPENFENVTWEMLKPIIEKIWENQINTFGFTLDEIIDTYQRLGFKFRDVAEYEYISQGSRDMIKQLYPWYIHLEDKRAFANIPIKQGRKILDYKQERMDVYLCEYQYRDVAANKVFRDLFLAKYPFLKDEDLFKVSEMEKVYYCDVLFDDLKDEELEIFFKGKTLKDIACHLSTNPNYMKLYAKKEVENSLVKCYFDSSIFFIDCDKEGKLDKEKKWNEVAPALLIPYKDFAERNFQGILNACNNRKDIVWSRYTEEAVKKYHNNPILDRLEKWCKEGK